MSLVFGVLQKSDFFGEVRLLGVLRGGSHDQVHLHHRRRRQLPGQGRHGRGHRPLDQRPRHLGVDPEAGPLPERRPRHHVPLPARRGLRHRGRRRDRPGPGPLRALHRREPQPGQQRHHRPDLRRGAAQGAARRLPGRHDPGHPPRHQRDQAPHCAWPAGTTTPKW